MVFGSFSDNFSKYRDLSVWKGIWSQMVPFWTVRLINHLWDRIKCLASCFIGNIFFLRLLLHHAWTEKSAIKRGIQMYCWAKLSFFCFCLYKYKYKKLIKTHDKNILCSRSKINQLIYYVFQTCSQLCSPMYKLKHTLSLEKIGPPIVANPLFYC